MRYLQIVALGAVVLSICSVGLAGNLGVVNPTSEKRSIDSDSRREETDLTENQEEMPDARNNPETNPPSADKEMTDSDSTPTNSDKAFQPEDDESYEVENSD